jgi:spore maturation protein CgeB
MRVVVLGAGGARKTETSIARAARELGHDCRLVNVVTWTRYAGPFAPRAIRYAAESYDPDFVVLTRHAILTGEGELRALLRGRRAAFWYFDLPPRPQVLALARLVGSMYVTSPGQVEHYRAAGVDEVRFLPQGVDPVRDRPARSTPPELVCDASFVGSGQYPHRYAVLRAVGAACRLQIRGPRWQGAPAELPVVGGPVHGRRLRQVIRGAAISLGANASAEQDTEPASASNRMWRILGGGGFYMGQHVPEIDAFAADRRHCVWYRSAEQAAELARHYLAHPDERQRIADAGRAHALEHHTYARRLELLLSGQSYQLAMPPQTSV